MVLNRCTFRWTFTLMSVRNYFLHNLLVFCFILVDAHSDELSYWCPSEIISYTIYWPSSGWPKHLKEISKANNMVSKSCSRSNCNWNHYFPEYCTSRAAPDLASSQYLHTLGKHLNEHIDVLWTGESIQTHVGTHRHPWTGEVKQISERTHRHLYATRTNTSIYFKIGIFYAYCHHNYFWHHLFPYKSRLKNRWPHKRVYYTVASVLPRHCFC